MNQLIKGSIDVLKINKEKLYKGKKGTYLNVVLIPTPTSDYGDWMIVEEATEEERKAGEKGTILGNAKVLVKKEEGSQEKNKPEDDSLPF